MSGSVLDMQKTVDQLNKADLGYDQGNRWSFLEGTMIVPNKEADCSSICGAIAMLGGYPVDLHDPFYTGNFREKLVAAGFSAISFSSLAEVKPGDFLLNEADHVEFAYTSAIFFSAHFDEHGNATGGQAGDQTGKEVGFDAAHVFSKGWDYILRPPVEAAPKPPKPQIQESDMLLIVINPNNNGQAVLNLSDGTYYGFPDPDMLNFYKDNGVPEAKRQPTKAEWSHFTQKGTI